MGLRVGLHNAPGQWPLAKHDRTFCQLVKLGVVNKQKGCCDDDTASLSQTLATRDDLRVLQEVREGHRVCADCTEDPQ